MFSRVAITLGIGHILVGYSSDAGPEHIPCYHSIASRDNKITTADLCDISVEMTAM